LRAAALEWDYGDAAHAYLKRPPYAPAAIADVLATIRAPVGARVCDVGAGTGNLTLPLAAAGFAVIAVEPNAAMRALGVERTAGAVRVRWLAASAEATALAAATCDVVTFGSSFNCVDGRRALGEAARILGADGSIVCLWNHRRLDDPLQLRVEAAICALVPDYAYGARRGDPTAALEQAGIFAVTGRIQRDVVHRVDVADWLAAWSSHVTLKRQAGARLPAVLEAIERVVRDGAGQVIDVPYTTRAWTARRRCATATCLALDERSAPE